MEGTIEGWTVYSWFSAVVAKIDTMCLFGGIRLSGGGLIVPMMPPKGPMRRMMISGSDILGLEPATIQFISSYIHVIRPSQGVSNDALGCPSSFPLVTVISVWLISNPQLSIGLRWPSRISKPSKLFVCSISWIHFFNMRAHPKKSPLEQFWRFLSVGIRALESWGDIFDFHAKNTVARKLPGRFGPQLIFATPNPWKTSENDTLFSLKIS